jgi:hypothetical protein
MAMDRQGVIYRTAEVSADLPEIILPAPPPTTLTIAGSSPVGRLAQLALKIKQIEPKESLKISYNRDGALCLRIRNGLVILGSTDDFENKLRILQDFREQNPGVLDGLQSFDLTAPSAPVKTYKKER